MRRKGGGRAWIACMLATLLVVALLATTALAQTQDNALTIHCEMAGTTLSGAQFSLYKVADVSQDMTYSETGAFGAYSFDLSGLDSEGWREMAVTLASWAQRDAMTPDASAQTDKSGDVCFAQMEDGLYLFVGAMHVQDGYRYTFEAGLVLLPGQENGEVQRQVLTQPKMEREKVGPIDIGVQKIWKDEGCEAFRPQSVTVQLLRNGKAQETIKLSAENNWKYEWKALEGGYEWRVVEKDPPGAYTDSYRREGNTFIVTNTYKTPGSTTPDEALPQTGLLWWPVPLLAGAGMILCFVGWRRQRNEEAR